jgi:hypothetical protein
MGYKNWSLSEPGEQSHRAAHCRIHSPAFAPTVGISFPNPNVVGPVDLEDLILDDDELNVQRKIRKK